MDGEATRDPDPRLASDPDADARPDPTPDHAPDADGVGALLPEDELAAALRERDPDLESGGTKARYVSFRKLLDVALVLAFGIAFLFTSVQGIVAWHAVRSEQWPTVEGTVVASRSTRIEGPRRKGARDWIEHEFRYVYTVDGQEFEGDRVTFSHDLDVAWYCDNFSRGDEGPVAYDPDDPSSAVLGPGMTDSLKQRLTKAGFWTVLFLVLGARRIWQRRRRRQRDANAPREEPERCARRRKRDSPQR